MNIFILQNEFNKSKNHICVKELEHVNYDNFRSILNKNETTETIAFIKRHDPDRLGTIVAKFEIVLTCAILARDGTCARASMCVRTCVRRKQAYNNNLQFDCSSKVITIIYDVRLRRYKNGHTAN